MLSQFVFFYGIKIMFFVKTKVFACVDAGTAWHRIAIQTHPNPNNLVAVRFYLRNIGRGMCITLCIDQKMLIYFRISYCSNLIEHHWTASPFQFHLVHSKLSPWCILTNLGSNKLMHTELPDLNSILESRELVLQKFYQLKN